MSRYAYVGATSGDLLTLNGHVIVHDNRDEMGWLCPNTSVVRVTDGDIGPVVRLADHPDLRQVNWPLNRTEFRA